MTKGHATSCKNCVHSPIKCHNIIGLCYSYDKFKPISEGVLYMREVMRPKKVEFEKIKNSLMKALKKCFRGELE